LAFKSNGKSLTTHHAEGNSMTSPTQTVVGRDVPNQLIAKSLLKNLRRLGPTFPPKNSLPITLHGMVGPQKYLYSFPQ